MVELANCFYQIREVDIKNEFNQFNFWQLLNWVKCSTNFLVLEVRRYTVPYFLYDSVLKHTKSRYYLKHDAVDILERISFSIIKQVTLAMFNVWKFSWVITWSHIENLSKTLRCSCSGLIENVSFNAVKTSCFTILSDWVSNYPNKKC